MDRQKEEIYGPTKNRITGVGTEIMSEEFPAMLVIFQELTERFTCVQVQVYTGVSVDTSDNVKRM